METKFTPGPWVVESNGSYFDVGVKNDSLTIPVHPNVCIGVTHKDEANAYLIAAAPEMYNLLERLTSHDNCKKDIIHLLGEADNLLAKARGENV